MKLTRLPLIIGLNIFITTLLYFLWLLLQPRPIIKLALATNSTPVSTTLTWYTSTPLHGCVYILEFPPRRFCDIQDKPVTNHYVNLTHLLPQRNYNLLIQTGLSFTRFPLPAKFIPDAVPDLPNPAYGRIVSPEGNPVPQATVIVFTKAGPLSTLTNDQGRWALDLRGQYALTTTLKLHLAWGKYYLTDQRLNIAYRQPTPDIILAPAFK